MPAKAGAAGSAFVWPQHYSFPPFFSKQPNVETNAIRVQMWKDLILGYCRHHRVFVLHVREAVATSPLFGNEAISRRLQPADANDIFHLMASAGLAEWYTSDGNKLMIHWRKPSEWASKLYEWVDGSGQVDSVLTLYELREGDVTMGTEFHGIDHDLLVRILKILESEGKAALLAAENGDVTGVKFLAPP